jgi:dTDP-4-amino-4,6-dideoxygalactose transaminase
MGTKEEILKDITSLLDSDKLSGFRGAPGMTEGGPMVQRLEGAFRDYFKTRYAISFNSATAALHAACVALQVSKGIVTPFSFTSSASCVVMAGGSPVFQDINPLTYCMDVDAFDEWYADAIIPVHIFGGMADMDKIMDLGVPVIEDASQAIGSRYKGKLAGTIGDIGVFSLNQSKTSSCGEGGMLITDDDAFALRAKLVRNHGEVVDPDIGITGYNYRMTEVEAVIAYHRFRLLDEIIAERKSNVEYFSERIGNIPGVEPQWINPDVDYSWYVYSFEVENNHEVARQMTEKGIFLRGGYVVEPLSRRYRQSCPVCEDVWSNKIIVTDVIQRKADMDKFITALGEVMCSGK